MFNNIKSFSVVKSSDIEGVIEGLMDMMEKNFYPLGLPFKNGIEYMCIIIEYKKIEQCQIN